MKKTIALFLCVALALSFSTPVTAGEAASLSVSTATEKVEVISKRDVYSKTYLLPDGSYQYVSYAEPIHYKDKTGSYTEIDNKISDAVKAEGYKYTNTANMWNAYFSEKLGTPDAVKMTDGTHQISFSFVGETGSVPVVKTVDVAKVSSEKQLSEYHKRLSADDRAVIYTDVMDQVDIAYTVQTGALKEDIILKSKPASATFRFRLMTNGLILRENAGTVGLYTDSGKEVFAFMPLYMEDANGKRSDSVTLAYNSIKNGYELTVTADPAFLNASDTVYPVVIDPSVMVTGADVTYDAYVDELYPDDNYYLSNSLWTGGELDNNAMRTYLKFDLPLYLSSNQITSAYIYLLKKDCQTPTIRAYRANGSWDSSSLTWNNKPSFSSLDYSSTATNTVGDWYGLDVTTIVKDWLAGTNSYYGFVLKEPYEAYRMQRTEFYSSDAPSPNKPELVINYIDLYYGSRPYQSTTRYDINCLGYALEVAEDIQGFEFGVQDIDMDGFPLAVMEDYVADCLVGMMYSEDWFVGSENWAYSSYDEDVNQGWYKIAFRVGFLDDNGNGIFDYTEHWDFHFWYQTSSGDWADKPGNLSSRLHLDTKDIDPTSLHWENGAFSYNSEGRFFQIRDIRDVVW